jgi:hypothetical protein
LTGYLPLGVVVAVFGCTGVVGSSDQLGGATLEGASSSASSAGSSASSAGSSGSDSSSAGSTSGAESTTAGSSNASAGSSNATPGSSEFPCDVQQLLATKCQLCHKATPPGTLLTSADFKRPSVADPTKSVGQLAVERVQATGAFRMPPAPLAAATAAEIAALSDWVQAGASPSTCGQTVAVAPDPYDTPVVCSSKTNWTGGNRESANMRPGGACISCHSKSEEGPRFSIGGTVYPTPHEPDDCNGVSSSAGAQVVITEANGTAHTLDVNSAGNFYLESATFAYPFQAKVVYQGRERVMVEAQKSGDCNNCHTQAGTQNAPGRIFLP